VGNATVGFAFSLTGNSNFHHEAACIAKRVFFYISTAAFIFPISCWACSNGGFLLSLACSAFIDWQYNPLGCSSLAFCTAYLAGSLFVAQSQQRVERIDGSVKSDYWYMSFIEVRNLRKVFKMGHQEVVALDNVNISIERSSFTVVMGPSGSGKSTLLYLLGGLDKPTSGSIIVEGTALENMESHELAQFRKKKVGFVFQAFHLIPSMPAIENVIFPMRFNNIPSQKRKERAKALLQQVGLSDRMHHLPTELSGGQQQRVAIARALANEPSLILADEPTGNLDRKIGAEIIHYLHKLNQEGHTIVLVTHDPTLLPLATQVIYMLDGRTVAEDEYISNISLIKTEEQEKV
jgi:putative ABC transport system ATP-binding protein